jgi:hypothetical protein
MLIIAAETEQPNARCPAPRTERAPSSCGPPPGRMEEGSLDHSVMALLAGDELKWARIPDPYGAPRRAGLLIRGPWRERAGPAPACRQCGCLARLRSARSRREVGRTPAPAPQTRSCSTGGGSSCAPAWTRGGGLRWQSSQERPRWASLVGFFKLLGAGIEFGVVMANLGVRGDSRIMSLRAFRNPSIGLSFQNRVAEGDKPMHPDPRTKRMRAKPGRYLHYQRRQPSLESPSELNLIILP